MLVKKIVSHFFSSMAIFVFIRCGKETTLHPSQNVKIIMSKYSLQDRALAHTEQTVTCINMIEGPKNG